MNYLYYKGYTATFEYDSEDHLLIGRVQGLRDVIGFHGATVAEFEAAFAAAIESYLENCAKLGHPPEKPASGKLMLRVPPEVHCAALSAAKTEGVSLNKWAARVLEKAALQSA
ncbi:MAG: type II toxin-antitoxin system HicB family antitoxin [Zoogloeaceae bacterium]|jgi:predicted HicB family RNase H-like nuclease|nr:type II toxin-antitoxin system HicB family antitoxin [Zoogloeaceae bacterium]